ncbi:hypothetical protein OEZ86_007382 [Tetradesmus obliquus]|nr:hypothetical protein OEZ86_007382 [Tetradesmus obliquus]
MVLLVNKNLEQHLGRGLVEHSQLVHAPNDAYIGLALLFDAWRHADGCLGLPGWPRVDPADLPSQQQLQEAADAVRAQADAVRQLKQGGGLSNKDPAVLEAVAALQQLKQRLAHLEALQQAFTPGRERPLQQLLLQKQQGAEGQQQPVEQ